MSDLRRETEFVPVREVDGHEALDRAILAPPLFLAGLVIVLAGSASLCVPIHRVAVPLECLLAFVLAVVFWRWRQPRARARMALLAVLACLAGWLTQVNFAGNFFPTPGDLLSFNPDNWSYQAMADYLDRYPRGKDGNLPMVDEFAVNLAGTRFGTPTLLAFLEDLPVFHDVVTAHVLLVMLCLTVHFFSMIAFGRALTARTGWGMPVLAAVLSTAGGWLCDAIQMANSDNVLFLAMCPALLALICPTPERTPIQWRTVAAGTILLSAMLYTYAEGMALLGVLISPLAVVLLWPGADRKAAFRRWGELGLIGVCGLLLTSPYLPTFYRFLQNQIAATAVPVGTRPGEGYFLGLLDKRLLPASFALGEEFKGSSYTWVNNLLPVCLLALLVVGAYTLTRRQRWFAWVVLPIAGLFFWQNVLKRYDYGSYKILICSTWWIYSAISAGVFWLADRFAWPGAVRAAAVAALLLAIGWEKYEDRRDSPPLASDSRVKEWHDLRTVHFVTGDAPILLALDDPLDYLWVTYYLRDVPLASWEQKGYLGMPHIAPYLARGNFPSPAACSFMLVPGFAPGALWHNARFSLVRRQSMYIADIDNVPNGIESVGNERFVWLGTQPAKFHVVAAASGDYVLAATAFGIGPSAPDKTAITVEIVDARSTHTAEVHASTHGLPIFLAEGPNEIRVRCLGVPEPGPHNGDPRELMLAVKGPAVNQPPAATVAAP